jgi:hypothetical protein
MFSSVTYTSLVIVTGTNGTLTDMDENPIMLRSFRAE